MNTRSTKKALLLSLLSLIVCITMLVGSTFAWFTDSVTSAQNVIKSGNLDVELYYTYDSAVAADVDSAAWVKVDSATDIFGYNLWEPGFTKVAYFKVANEGSLALKYKLSADVYNEVPGKNKKNETFYLSDKIKTALVPVGVTQAQIHAMDGVSLKASYGMSADHLTAKGTANDTKVVGLAVWMPTTVGDEANHNGTEIPSVTFGINLIATQDTVESDSFGSDYDTEAVYPNINFPSIVTANKKVDTTGNTPSYEIPLYSPEINDDGEYSKQGSVTVPKDAIDPNAEEIEVVIKKLSEADSSVALSANEAATTIDITVEGIKENNTEIIEVVTNIGKGLVGVKVFHKNDELTQGSEFIYDPVDGVLKIYTTSFSPFTIVYNSDEVYEAPDIDIVDPDAPGAVEGLPTATVTRTPEHENKDLPWGSYGAWSPTEGLDAQLEAAYTFSCNETPEQAALNKFAHWNCDFYVKLDRDLGENQIFLGGKYGTTIGWVGFHNGDITLKANEEIPLLQSVAGPWSYLDVASNVGTFICGVGDVDDALKGATFTVMLRLVDPEDETNYVNVSTVNYTFE